MLFVLQYSVYFSNESFSFYYISKNKYRPSTNINYKIPEDVERLKNINDSVKKLLFCKISFWVFRNGTQHTRTDIWKIILWTIIVSLCYHHESLNQDNRGVVDL